jgi:hypothetical protein
VGNLEVQEEKHRMKKARMECFKNLLTSKKQLTLTIILAVVGILMV